MELKNRNPGAVGAASGADLKTANVSGIEQSKDSKTGIAGQADDATFPQVIAEWPKNSREVVRIAIEEYRGMPMVGIRIWYRGDNDELCPGRSGVTLTLDKHLPQLAEAIGKAVLAARDLGLLNDGGAK